MIALEHAGRRFTARRTEPVDALIDVSLTVPAGSVFGIVGPNGAGKTTLFALVLGFLGPTTGTVLVGGTDPRAWARTRGAAWLPERFALPSGWRVRDGLRALARLEGLDPKAARAAAEAAIERLDLGPHADKTADTVSRGTLQRVGLAQALLAPRDLVVLDEPTQGLDPLWRVKLREVVADLSAQGRTVLLASHELDEVERLADHAAVLRDGRLQDVVVLRGAAGDGVVYRITLERASAALAVAFPGAEKIEDEAAAWRVRVADTTDLTERLAALIDGGARIVGVQPGNKGLEARVRGKAAPESRSDDLTTDDLTTDDRRPTTDS